MLLFLLSFQHVVMHLQYIILSACSAPDFERFIKNGSKIYGFLQHLILNQINAQLSICPSYEVEEHNSV